MRRLKCYGHKTQKKLRLRRSETRSIPFRHWCRCGTA